MLYQAKPILEFLCLEFGEMMNASDSSSLVRLNIGQLSLSLSFSVWLLRKLSRKRKTNESVSS